MSKQLFLGIMSGTSLDGIDLILVDFSIKDNRFGYKIVAVKTFSYNKKWKEKLATAAALKTEDLLILDQEYGKFIAQKCNEFISNLSLEKEVVICSHGHTVFHQPEKGFTLQIGNGATIVAYTNYTVINNFRSLDVALGGQGAPLVPVGDFYLFGKYPFCLNLGGIANISIQQENKITAYDVCPCNMALNDLATALGKDYDENGDMAASGKIIEKCLMELNKLDFYKKKSPKSLGREWFENNFSPILNKYKSKKAVDLLATVCEHIAMQISSNINAKKLKGNCLVTGGGAYNEYLLSRIRHYSNNELFVPDRQTIDFKEALIFAFLGYLRMNNKINCFSSVTGAKRDSIVGNLITTL